MMHNTQNTEKNKTEEAGERFQPYESNPEKSSTPRERPGEGTRPYGSSPDKPLSLFPTCTICRALLCAEIEGEANPKRR